VNPLVLMKAVYFIPNPEYYIMLIEISQSFLRCKSTMFM